MPQRNHPVLPLAKPPCRKAYLGRKLCGKRKHINFQALSVIVECFFAAGLLPVCCRLLPGGPLGSCPGELPWRALR